MLMRRRNPRVLIPFLAVGGVSLILVTNPYDLVWNMIRHSSLISEICRSWYFLAGITAAAAPLAAYGLDDFLNRDARPAPRPLFWLTLSLIGGWASWELWRYLHRDAGFASGWRSIFDPAITAAVVGLALFVFRAVSSSHAPSRQVAQATLAIALVLGVGIDYKVFGTRKRFNADRGSGQSFFSDSSFPGFDSAAYREMKAHTEYRIALDPAGPFPLDLRHAGLTTPQGFDPFFTAQYRDLLQGNAHFRTNWEFDIDPENESAMRLFGVRYVVTSAGSAFSVRVATNPRLHPIGSSETPYRVFEYESARPPYGFVGEAGKTSVDVRLWTPELREFVVNSDRGGQFALHEQLLPGWQALLDGKSVSIQPLSHAFQAVDVAPGSHTIQFRYQPRILEIGAWISLVSLLSLGAIFLRPRPRS